MSPLARWLVCGLSLIFLTPALRAAPALEPIAPQGKAPAAAPVAEPALLDYVTFVTSAGDDDNKIVVTTGGPLVRIDELSEGYSIIYDPKAQRYLGLENRNYTWWDFSWPEVQAAVQKSSRYQKRIEDLSASGMGLDRPATTNAAPNTQNLAAANDLDSGDASGVVWRQAGGHQKIAGFPCVRWTGESADGQKVEAWCYAERLPKIDNAIAQLHTTSNPMALVAIREIAPDFIYPVYDALEKGGVTPLLINWGTDTERHQFRLLEVNTRKYDPKLFAVPKLFIKTTLVTMDGLIDSQPARPLPGTHTPPRVDHSTPQPDMPEPMGR